MSFIIFMEGYIISYEDGLTSKQITEINYYLFGKVLSKNGKKYYYHGILDSIFYMKLGNGCYFVSSVEERLIQELKASSTFFIIFTDLKDVNRITLDTARNNKRKKYKDIYVKNL